jgi:uncharacterized protein YbaP (TraB family)
MISGKDLAEPSYLYGTIHILPKEQFEIPKSLERAFKTCNTLAMEVDLNMSASEKIAMAQRAVIADGKTLKDLMEPQDYIRLKMYCIDSLKWSESKFERSSHLQPMFFSSLMVQESMTNMASYEMEFNKMAKKQHKKTMGLETIDFQLSLFEQLPMSTQVGMLKEDYQSSMKSYDTLLACYLKEDLEQLGKLMAEETNESTANSFFLRSLSTVSGRKAPNFLPAQERVRQRRDNLEAEDSESIIWFRKSLMCSSSQGRGTPSF